MMQRGASGQGAGRAVIRPGHRRDAPCCVSPAPCGGAGIGGGGAEIGGGGGGAGMGGGGGGAGGRSMLRPYVIVAVALILTLILPTAARATAAPEWTPIYTRVAPALGATIDVRAVGDIMLARHVAGARAPWSTRLDPVTSLLSGDITIGNLESVLTTQPPVRGTGVRLIGPPAATAALAGRVSLVGLANNHARDAGAAGLAETVATLRTAQIGSVGAGATATAAAAPYRTTINGLRVAVFAGNDTTGALDASADGGMAPARLDAPLLTTIRSARAAADLVIVLAHWGTEYLGTPTERQRAAARALVAAGADLIIGAHPHVLQPVELVESGGRRGVVLFSLGNFLFDQTSRRETGSGVVARVLLDVQGVVSVSAAPVDTLAGVVYPLPANSREGALTLAALGARTDAGLPVAPHPTLRGYVLRGANLKEMPIARRSNPIDHPRRVLVDLRGDGQRSLAILDDAGVLRVYAGETEDSAVGWTTATYGWRAFRVLAGDPNRDGRQELLVLLWKPDRRGVLAVHPYLIGYRGGAYKVIWGGSPRPTMIRDVALSDLDGDGFDELVYLEGGASEADAGSEIGVYQWGGWVFSEVARVRGGPWYAIDARAGGVVAATMPTMPTMP